MKLIGFTTTIAIGLSALITYGFYEFSIIEEGSKHHLMMTVFSFIISSITLVPGMGISFDTNRLTLVIRLVSLISFFIGITILFVLNTLILSVPLLVMIVGVFLLLFTLIIFLLYQSKQ